MLRWWWSDAVNGFFFNGRRIYIQSYIRNRSRFRVVNPNFIRDKHDRAEQVYRAVAVMMAITEYNIIFYNRSCRRELDHWNAQKWNYLYFKMLMISEQKWGGKYHGLVIYTLDFVIVVIFYSDIISIFQIYRWLHDKGG